MGASLMKLATSLRGIGRWHGWARDDGAVLFCFAATLFASALLLFSVQPMFAKLVLPKLGGSPSVWAVSMCFFQAMLLAGYGYAYILNRYLDDRRAVMVHLSLLAATCLALPFGLPAAFAEPPAGDAYAWLIGLLVAGVGLPFFAIAGNAPLLQAWFSRTGHPHANDPYFLYRASNIGSLIALLAYPLVLEPNLGLLAQSRYWSYGFFALGAMIAICGGLLLVNVVRPQTSVVAAKNEVADANPSFPLCMKPSTRMTPAFCAVTPMSTSTIAFAMPPSVSPSARTDAMPPSDAPISTGGADSVRANATTSAANAPTE